MGRGAQGVAIAGLALLCGFVALVLTGLVLFLLHSDILFGSCQVFPSGRPQVCTPQTWKWILSSAGVVGAAAGGIGASLFMRHQTRLHDKLAPPVGQLSDCVSPRRPAKLS